MAQHKASARFRIWSSEMSTDSIRDSLGLAPTEIYEKGELVSRRSKTVRTEHLFILNSGKPNGEPLELHLLSLCDLIEPVKDKLIALLGRCECDIFCGFTSDNGQGGFFLTPQLLGRLAALNVEVIFDLYPGCAGG